MRRLLLLVIFVLAANTQVFAKEPPEVILQSLPMQIKTFTAEKPVSYEDKRLGASIGYTDSIDHIAITVYLYDLGSGYVADGINSQIITAKNMAVAEIKKVESMGYYTNVKNIADGQTYFQLDAGNSLKLLKISFSYDFHYENKKPELVASDLYLVGLKGYICKIRVTRPAIMKKEAEKRTQETLETLVSIFKK